MVDKRKTNNDYIPALHSSKMTPVYDTLMRITMREFTFKKRLIENASIIDGYRILDLGCGTATLSMMVKQKYPAVDVIGFDPDRESIIYAVKKINKAGMAISLMQSTASNLPFPDSSFDRVLSSLVIHHLLPEDRIRAMREVFRVLRPDSRFLLADFGEPHNHFMALNSRITDSVHDISDNLKEIVPKLMKEVGFNSVKQLDRFSTAFGTVKLYSGSKDSQ